MRSNPHRSAPLWLFGLVYIPFGVSGGFIVTMGALARQANIVVEQIGWYGFALLFPTVIQFLYAPLVDVGLKRRAWLVVMALLGAGCLCLALTMPLPDHINAFLGFAVAGQVTTGLVGSCVGGLISTTVPNEARGRASGWLNAGNLGGSALGVWLTLTLSSRGVAPLHIGLSLAALMVLPALGALFVHEPERPQLPPRQLFTTLAHDVWATARSRAGWTGILFCLSPVGTAALANYLSSVAVDYQATPAMTAFVNGPLNGVVTALGCLVGGLLCDRMNRRAAYLISGGLTALVGFAMVAAPLVPLTYALGAGAYLFVTGLCYASFYAVVLETIGAGGAAAATEYTLFTSAGNLAIAYTGWIDTRLHHRYGPRALFGSDATANLVGVVLLGLLLKVVFRHRASVAARRARC